MNKLLSVAVPCYNSQNYMEHAVQTLLSGGGEMEILIVNDGSTDGTGAIADRLAREHPGVVYAIHQPNKGHGGAVTAGLRAASGAYFKVVDSDDWVDEAALKTVLAQLRVFSWLDEPVDLLVSNYVYDKVGKKPRPIRYTSALRPNRVLGWDEVGRFHKWENLLMHSLIYRTEVLRQSGLQLPEHTFYVDNLYATVPLASVKSLYYLNVDLYHYFIGRDDQSIQEQTMIRRIDQQLRVNRLMLEQIDLEHIENRRQQETILHYHDIITAVTNILLLLAATPEHRQMQTEFWRELQRAHPWEYQKLRRSLFGVVTNLPGRLGRQTAIAGYRVARRIFGFN